jgi:tripartite-type tricarboxylate transporter receptor subunit TctC
MKRFVASAVLAIASFLIAAGVAAQDFPSKPIRIVIPFGAGGSTDNLARLIGEYLQGKWGQPVIVEARPGAGGNIAAEYVYKSAPDGYTLLLTTPGPVAINQQLYSHLGFDPEKLVSVTWLTRTPNLLVVPPNTVSTVPQLIAAAKAKPDGLSYGSSGIGTTTHLAAESLNMMAGIKTVHIPYKSTPAVVTDLMTGRVQLLFMTPDGTLSQIRAGTVKLIAVGTDKRSPLFPDTPTVAETLPGFVSMTWAAIVAPPGTPPAIVTKLNEGFVEAMKQPNIVKTQAELGADVIASTPAELDALRKAEIERWGAVIKATGAKLD